MQTTPFYRCTNKLAGDSNPHITSGSKIGVELEISRILSLGLNYWNTVR